MSGLYVWHNSRLLRLGLVLILGLTLLVGLLLVMNLTHSLGVALADGPTIRYVAPAPVGSDSGNDCTGSSAPCATIQRAVDVADAGDEVRVATGVYTDVHVRPRADIASTGVVTQVVYISKTVTLRGGYATTDWGTSNPISYPTALDAQRQGRVIYVTGDISPTIDGLRITGGSAAGSGGALYGWRTGGGIYVITASTTLLNNTILSNTTGIEYPHSYGGGVYVLRSPSVQATRNTIADNQSLHGGGLCFEEVQQVLLTDNIIRGNVAGAGAGLYSRKVSKVVLTENLVLENRGGRGSGAYFEDSPGATLVANTIEDNNESGGGMGGGLHFYKSPSATLTANVIRGNEALYGGGVYLRESSGPVIAGNTIADNKAHGQGYRDSGGGLYLEQSDNIVLIGNAILRNLSTEFGGGVQVEACDDVRLMDNVVADGRGARGGGLNFSNSTQIELTGNTLSNNWSWGRPGGGGACFSETDHVTLTGNVIVNNNHWRSLTGGGLAFVKSAHTNLIGNTVFGNRVSDLGGGIVLISSDVTMTNNMIAENGAGTVGSGLYVTRSSVSLLHTTIARNDGGDGSGIHVAGTGSTVALTNTILVSHTVGITVAAGNTATLEAALWGTDTWANLADWGGAGTIRTGTINLWGDPDFVDPDAEDYHIGFDSAAMDAGVDAGVREDIDGDPRPYGVGYDIGADEFPIRLIYLPLVARK
jgi:parallel beta-helix repeat protein